MQKIVIAHSQSSFESEVKELLDLNWEIVPGTFSFTKQSAMYSPTTGNPYWSQDTVYFVVLSKGK